MTGKTALYDCQHAQTRPEENPLGYDAPLPEYSFYETVQAPDISWRRAKRAVATATDIHPFVTIEGWRTRPWYDGTRWRKPDVELRPLMGDHHNEARIKRLLSTRPHGVTDEGLPWYVGVLYPAPTDPIWGYDDLVGIVTWVGHVACLLPGGGRLWRPMVELLAEQSRHLLVPVVPDEGDLLVLSPSSGWDWRRHYPTSVDRRT